MELVYLHPAPLLRTSQSMMEPSLDPDANKAGSKSNQLNYEETKNLCLSDSLTSIGGTKIHCFDTGHMTSEFRDGFHNRPIQVPKNTTLISTACDHFIGMR